MLTLTPKTLERPKALILNWWLVLKISGFIFWRYSLESCSYSPPGLGFRAFRVKVHPPGIKALTLVALNIPNVVYCKMLERFTLRGWQGFILGEGIAYHGP